ncbi:DNA-directed RNA polymerase [Microbacterium sp. HM58-2]|nr:DNA-directed RNA polymerase [Microbacterium sp. HM58-2]
MSDSSRPSPLGDEPPAPSAPAAQPVQPYPGATPVVPAAPSYPAQAPSYPAQAPAYGAQPPAYGAQPPAYGAAAAPAQAQPAQAQYGAVAPQQQAPGYTAYGAPAYAAPRPNSGLAITSLICGIAGLVLSVLLFWAIFPILISVAAVITGHLALRQLRRTPGLGGRGMAITGLITGYVGCAFLVFTVVAIVIGAVFLGAFTLPFIFSS